MFPLMNLATSAAASRYRSWSTPSACFSPMDALASAAMPNPFHPATTLSSSAGLTLSFSLCSFSFLRASRIMPRTSSMGTLNSLLSSGASLTTLRTFRFMNSSLGSCSASTLPCSSTFQCAAAMALPSPPPSTASNSRRVHSWYAPSRRCVSPTL